MAAEPKFKVKLQKNAHLLRSIKRKLPALENLLKEISGHWTYEDGIYRFYHQSFKVYDLRYDTLKIVDTLKSLMPNQEINGWFLEVVKAGTGKQFKTEDNRKWLRQTRPIVEAFLHAKFFLEMICKYGRELKKAPDVLPSGWAAVLYLYNAR